QARPAESSVVPPPVVEAPPPPIVGLATSSFDLDDVGSSPSVPSFSAPRVSEETADASDEHASDADAHAEHASAEDASDAIHGGAGGETPSALPDSVPPPSAVGE